MAKGKLTQSRSIKDTHKHAKEFARAVKKLPALILLEGPLGAGKTEWARAFISGYLGKKTVVTSPTFSIVNAHKAGRKVVYHFDLYRLASADDLESVGFWDFLGGKNVLLVEWGEQLPEQWPKGVHVYRLRIEPVGESDRKLELNQPF